MAEIIIGKVIWQDADRLSGAICFYGTRLPVARLFEWLADGKTVPQFCDHWDISPEMALGVLKLAETSLIRD